MRVRGSKGAQNSGATKAQFIAPLRFTSSPNRLSEIIVGENILVFIVSFAVSLSALFIIYLKVFLYP